VGDEVDLVELRAEAVAARAGALRGFDPERGLEGEVDARRAVGSQVANPLHRLRVEAAAWKRLRDEIVARRQASADLGAAREGQDVVVHARRKIPEEANRLVLERGEAVDVLRVVAHAVRDVDADEEARAFRLDAEERRLAADDLGRAIGRLALRLRARARRDEIELLRSLGPEIDRRELRPLLVALVTLLAGPAPKHVAQMEPKPPLRDRRSLVRVRSVLHAHFRASDSVDHRYDERIEDLERLRWIALLRRDLVDDLDGIEKGIDRPALERFAELLHRAADRHLSRRAREPRDLLREELRDERDRLRLLSARLRFEERLEGRREQHSRDERLRSRLGRSVAPKLRDALSKRIERVRLDRRHELRRPP